MFGSEGRYSRTVPGAGLAESWGIREELSTSTFHLKIDREDLCLDGLTPDQIKAIKSSGGLEGGEFLPLAWDGRMLFGSRRYAELSGHGTDVMSEYLKEKAVICRKKIGKGTVVYCGTCLGAASKKSAEVFDAFISSVADRAGVRPAAVIAEGSTRFDSVHVDLMRDPQGALCYIVMNNRSDSAVEVELPEKITEIRGLFSKRTIKCGKIGRFAIPAKFIDMMETAK